MHEEHMIDGLVKQIEQVARRHECGAISGVRVRLGALAHISADHLRAHFAMETAGTIADGAKLEIDQSSDILDPHAQDIVLETVEVEVAV